MDEYENRASAMNQHARNVAREKYEAVLSEAARKRELDEAVLKQLKICKWTLVATVIIGSLSIAVTLFLAFRGPL